MSDPLQNIIFIAVPDSLERQIGEFSIDPDRMLPVETTGGGERYDIQDLAWEQIVAGMLKILAYSPKHEDADYYREFVLAITPEIIDELTETAVLKSRNEDFSLAEEIFLALRGLQPNDQRALVNLALFYDQRSAALRAAEHENAIEYEDRAKELYDELFAADDVIAEGHLNAGYFYARLQDYRRARNHLTVFVDRGEDESQKAEVREFIEQIDQHDLGDEGFRVAYEKIRSGNEDEGIELVREFIGRNPEVWNAWFLLGWAHRRKSEFAAAKDAFEKALDFGPRQADTLNELAICHLELGDPLGARALLAEALAEAPEDTKIISNLGIVELKSGNAAEAASFFQTVLEINPEDSIAKAYLRTALEQS